MKSPQVTIHDIAKILKISASTVSRALSDHPRISTDTKKKVKALAKKLGYQPNIVASNLRVGKTNTVGIVVPRINRNFFSNVIGGFEEVVSNAGYRMMITQTNETYNKEVENIKALINARVDGIIISLSAGTKAYNHFKLVQRNGIPLIFFDRATDKIESSKVVIDDLDGGYSAVNHLISQGCKKIAHFAGPEHLIIYSNRKKGYLNALKKRNIDIRDDYIVNDIITKDTGFDACRHLMGLKDKPDAIFAASDFSALGAMVYLKENGYKIPDDVALVGFANEPFTSLIEPGLTSVDQHSNEIGIEVAKLFLDEVKHTPASKICRDIIIKPDLIIRKSSRKKT
ncbi:MAG: LacI family DNA-binding transcriptional regulator [Bacteroidales bacterium]|nr:MAG: LacI family DNA-binding transcriptional regulator [Bacteroidales bacterium]